MKNKILGFVGVESYDILQFIAQVLVAAGRKVLLIDNSETQSLHCSIYYPLELNPEKCPIEYNGFLFASRTNLVQIADLVSYDNVLIYFGFHVTHPDLQRCACVNFVTDLQKHNAIRLVSTKTASRINLDGESLEVKKTLLVRNIIKCKITADYVQELLKRLNLEKSQRYEMSLDLVDYKIRLYSQYNQLYQFKQITPNFKLYLQEVLEQQCDLSEQELFKVWKIAERGAK